MRSSIISLSAIAAANFAPLVSAGLNILLTNDDGWSTANIRASHKYLKDAGHNVLMVAPVNQQSGTGGTFNIADTDITSETDFGYVAAGAPYYGSDPEDESIFYVNATPAASAVFGIDVVSKDFFKGEDIDLVVSGPNEGNNIGNWAYTLSGTIGATYTSVLRGYPGIAISGNGLEHRDYKDWKDDKYDEATIIAKVLVTIVNRLESNLSKFNTRLLPPGVGLNVNTPAVNESNPSPEFVNTRIVGNTMLGSMTLDEGGFPVVDYLGGHDPAADTIYNGDSKLPSETDNVQAGKVSISIFTTDYDAPRDPANKVKDLYKDLIGKGDLIQ